MDSYTRICQDNGTFERAKKKPLNNAAKDVENGDLSVCDYMKADSL